MRAAVDPAVSLSTHSLLPMVSFVDHVDQAAPRAPGRWTTARPAKGMTRGRGNTTVAAHAVESTRVDWFSCRKITGGVEGGGMAWPTVE